MQIYLEMVLTREDGVKEVKLLQLGRLFLKRYVDIFLNIYKEDRIWFSDAAFGGTCYRWPVVRFTLLTVGLALPRSLASSLLDR